ncbi:MAG: hypothetical protein ACK5B9_06910 [Flavobacteriia bacterium]
MTENIERAKKIFLDFGTSGYHMMREGVLDEYKSYNISKEKENEWRLELINKKLLNFNINDQSQPFSFRSLIQTHDDISTFEKYLIKVGKTSTSSINGHIALLFGQDLFSTLYELTRSNIKVSREIRLECIDTCEKLLLIAKKIGLPDNYKINTIEIFEEKLTQEQYFQRQINKFEYEIGLAKLLK